MRKIIVSFLLFCYLININVLSFAQINIDVKYPSFYKAYLKEDKHEKINRKIFNFNLKLNKIFVRNIHIIWESIFPKSIITILNSAYYNLEYPKRFVSIFDPFLLRSGL